MLGKTSLRKLLRDFIPFSASVDALCGSCLRRKTRIIAYPQLKYRRILTYHSFDELNISIGCK